VQTHAWQNAQAAQARASRRNVLILLILVAIISGTLVFGVGVFAGRASITAGIGTIVLGLAIGAGVIALAARRIGYLRSIALALFPVLLVVGSAWGLGRASTNAVECRQDETAAKQFITANNFAEAHSSIGRARAKCADSEDATLTELDRDLAIREQTAKNAASADLIAWQAQQPTDITLSATAERGSTGEVAIVGSTNLPDGTKIGAEVDGAQDFNIRVSRGAFRSAGFTNGTRALPQGPHKIRILAYFNEAWQSAKVLGAIGKGGSRLNVGTFIKLEDKNLVDSAKLLDATMTVQFPPLSLDSVAVDLVKKAILTVDGRRSATNVEANIAFFMQGSSEIRPARGWLTSGEGGSKFLVSYSFINGSLGEESATWEADVTTKLVRYTNTAAKNFSWVPAE